MCSVVARCACLSILGKPKGRAAVSSRFDNVRSREPNEQINTPYSMRLKFSTLTMLHDAC
eukprot:6208286-Pleurochrysis_carterae.AAC.2